MRAWRSLLRRFGRNDWLLEGKNIGTAAACREEEGCVVVSVILHVLVLFVVDGHLAVAYKSRSRAREVMLIKMATDHSTGGEKMRQGERLD